MPNSEISFPHHLPLNGADYFLLHLDHLMWQSCRRRNLCIFTIALSSISETDALVSHVVKHPAYQWLCRLRLQHNWPFCIQYWRFEADATVPEIMHYQLKSDEELPDTLLASTMDIRRESAFSMAVCHRVGQAGALLVFTWHHVLMDAHGGEAFIRYLGQRDTHQAFAWEADTTISLPFVQRAKTAQAMKRFLFNAAQLPVLTLSPTVLKANQLSLRYRFLAFTEAQSEQIYQRARTLGAGFLVSMFLLAATTCAVTAIQQRRGLPLEDVLVPIPQDKRKRGSDSPVLGNQVSFLFYRIPKSALTDISACTAELVEQMKGLMRNGSTNDYSVMMEFLRRIPGLFYRRMLKAPTQGLMASFYYSDTGDSLQQFNEWLGQPVSDARHYPPNLYPPGITFIFSRCQGSLRLTLGYMEPVISDAESEALLTTLSALLLPEHGAR